MEETPATIAASEPWLDQAEKLFGPAELGGLLNELGPATRDLAGLAHEPRELLPEVDRFNRCVASRCCCRPRTCAWTTEPAGRRTENYKEFWYAMVGQAGGGAELRRQRHVPAARGAGRRPDDQSGKTNYTGESLFGNVTTQPLAHAAGVPRQAAADHA